VEVERGRAVDRPLGGFPAVRQIDEVGLPNGVEGGAFEDEPVQDRGRRRAEGLVYHLATAVIDRILVADDVAIAGAQPITGFGNGTNCEPITVVGQQNVGAWVKILVTVNGVMGKLDIN